MVIPIVLNFFLWQRLPVVQLLLHDGPLPYPPDAVMIITLDGLETRKEIYLILSWFT